MSNKRKEQIQISQNIQEFVNKIKTKDFIDDEIIALSEGIGKELSEITTTKMRQYFADIKGLRRKIKAQLTDQQLKVQLRLIQSRIAYDVGREPEKRRRSMEKLKTLIDKSVSKIMSGKDIKTLTDNFITFFETMFGYFYYESKSEGGEKE